MFKDMITKALAVNTLAASLTVLAIILGASSAQATEEPTIPVPAKVHAVSTAGGTPNGPIHHLVDYDHGFGYADGGVILFFDNGLSLAFPPRYMARDRCWDDGAWLPGCSRRVFAAYHWKRDLLSEFKDES